MYYILIYTYFSTIYCQRQCCGRVSADASSSTANHHWSSPLYYYIYIYIYIHIHIYIYILYIYIYIYAYIYIVVVEGLLQW